jgi:3-oxoacyl-[acyl-carrier protein] reductase
MIIVSGASGGIGRVVVDQLRKLDSIIAIYNSSDLINKDYDNVKWVQANLLKNSNIDKIVNELKDAADENITFVNMSSIKKDGLLVNYDLAEWNDVISLNITSVFYFTKMLLPLMIEKRWGRFIFITSTGGMRGDIGTVSYSTSKTALIGFSKVISKEYARFNITSNILSLGTFDTGMFHKINDNKKKEILKSIPSKKVGNISNIVNAVEFINKSDYVNGSIISIDGGM